MPIHDWTRVDAGLFHHFHQRWISALCDALNTGGLPADYFALAAQVVGPIPDVLTLQHSGREVPEPGSSGGKATTSAPPRTRHVLRAEINPYLRKVNRVTVRHKLRKVVAILEIVSPGNKDSRHALRSFVQKMVDLLHQGIHVLVVDLFPPSKRDPQGIHKAIWVEIDDEEFALPPEKPLTLAAYSAGLESVAYVEPVAVGDSLPDMPLFLEPEEYVWAPLEATYQLTWDVFPAGLKASLV